MEYNCGFQMGDHWFRYRTGGIIIHNDKMLFVKSGVGDYFYMIGGAVHLGETSKCCIEREVLEETGIKAHADHLSVVCENFFKGHDGAINNLDCHTIEFYYYMTIENMDELREKTDIGEELVWIPVSDIGNYRIKPDFIAERIGEIISDNKMLHIIEERDR